MSYPSASSPLLPVRTAADGSIPAADRGIPVASGEVSGPAGSMPTASGTIPAATGSMPVAIGAARNYSVAGGVLRSTLDFPELEPIDAAVPDWTLEVATIPAPNGGLLPLGERSLGQETYRLWASANGGFRLEYSHAGCFDLAQDGRSLVWYPSPNAQVELARSIVLGPALSLALELAGYLCLHGSAVAISGQGVVFLGPKFHGKSTIATALTAAGAKLISDDLVAVAPGPPARIRAGVASVRLWKDSAKELGVGSLCDSVTDGIKTTASRFTGRVMTERDAPLAAIYLLTPVADDADRVCWRTPIAGAAAAIGLAHQTKLPAPLIGTKAAGRQLKAAAATAAAVPVFQLHIVRNFARLPEVVSQIREWHQADTEGAKRGAA